MYKSIQWVPSNYLSNISNTWHDVRLLQEAAAEGAKNLMDNIRQVSFNKPFPVEEIQNIQDTASGKELYLIM